MADIKISLKDIRKTKKAEIDGHIYTVRKIGAGEQMDLLRLGKKMQKLEGKNGVETIDEVEKIRRQILEIYVGLFDDGEDGKRSREMLSPLGDDEIASLIEFIFKED